MPVLLILPWHVVLAMLHINMHNMATCITISPCNIVLGDHGACLVDSAMACSIGNVTCLTKQQVLREKANAFVVPDELKSGSVRPSESSDVFSFGETVKFVFLTQKDSLPKSLLKL